MKRLIPVLFIALVFFSGCEKEGKDQGPVNVLPTGIYQGTFNRTGMDAVQVSLNFAGDQFRQAGTPADYPAICKGSYAIEGSRIIFHDSCSWQANFDWSLILNGSYNFSGNDSSVRIWRKEEAGTDEYLLARIGR